MVYDKNSFASLSLECLYNYIINNINKFKLCNFDTLFKMIRTIKFPFLTLIYN